MVQVCAPPQALELLPVSCSDATGVVTEEKLWVFFFFKAREAAKTKRTAEQAPPCAPGWA